LSPMGTRIRFLGWVPYQGLGTPLFPTHSTTATSSATLGDRDRRASTVVTGRRIVPSIAESLFGRVWGCFWRAGRGPEWSAPTRRAAVKSRNSLAGTASTRDQPCRTRSRRRFRRGVHGRSCRTWRLNRAPYTSAENPPIPGSVKAKGFSRFLGRIIAVLLSVVGSAKLLPKSRS